MAKVLSQNYSYAQNSSGDIIHVSTARRNENYFCPICGELMNPHMGKVRRWHFVHKKAGSCSYESYLHKLAKIRIKRAFLSAKQFLLSYEARAICSHECPFIGSPKCERERTVEFDLRNYYDTCEIEAAYHQYRADLLLTSSTNPKRPPVLIEIMVTHKCTEEKIRDGVRIIEIAIHSEEQIDNIVNSCKLTAVRDQHFSFCSDERDVTLYNFNKIVPFDPIGSLYEYEDGYNRKNTIVFWLDKYGRFGSFNCHCYEVREKLPTDVHYFITETATSSKEILQEFSKRGVKIRNCFLCRFSKQDLMGKRLCVLYKKHNLPRKPSPYRAIRCPHYREDFGVQQNMAPIGEPPSTELTGWYQGHKSYCHICNDIL